MSIGLLGTNIISLILYSNFSIHQGKLSSSKVILNQKIVLHAIWHTCAKKCFARLVHRPRELSTLKLLWLSDLVIYARGTTCAALYVEHRFLLGKKKWDKELMSCFANWICTTICHLLLGLSK
jgi:hypothetical protein